MIEECPLADEHRAGDHAPTRSDRQEECHCPPQPALISRPATRGKAKPDLVGGGGIPARERPGELGQRLLTALIGDRAEVACELETHALAIAHPRLLTAVDALVEKGGRNAEHAPDLKQLTGGDAGDAALAFVL